MGENPKRRRINPKQLANLRPPFDGSKAGPGRPPIPEEIKQQRREALEILKEASPYAAARLFELARSPFGDIAIRACTAILSKTTPNLEETRIVNPEPDPAMDTRLAQALLDAVRRGADPAVRAQN